MWTRFMDMHSGGGSKEKWNHIYIEAPQAEAEVIFYNRFGHNPNRITCTCCGNDYSITSSEDLAQLTAFDRGCAYDECGKYVEKQNPEQYASRYRTLDEYKADPDVLVIPASEIKPEERQGEVPVQGFVWVE